MGNSFGKNCTVLHESCTTALDTSNFVPKIDLSFLDPPFNQDKAYNAWDDNLPPEKYWAWMREICAKVYALTSNVGKESSKCLLKELKQQLNFLLV